MSKKTLSFSFEPEVLAWIRANAKRLGFRNPNQLFQHVMEGLHNGTFHPKPGERSHENREVLDIKLGEVAYYVIPAGETLEVIVKKNVEGPVQVYPPPKEKP